MTEPNVIVTRAPITLSPSPELMAVAREIRRMSQPSQKPPQSGARLLAFSGSSYDPETREAEVVITTSAPVRRWGMIEILSMKANAVDLSRVGLGQVKLLDSHETGSVESVLGVLVSARIDGERLLGVVRFGETEEAAEAAAMVARGEITGISCGYRVNEWERTAFDQETDVETWTATRWELFEVSLVSVPADKFAGVRAAERFSPESTTEERNTGMPEINSQQPETPVEETRAAPAPAPAPAPAADLAAERRRSAEIMTIGQRHGIDAALVSAAVADGVSLDAFRAQVLDTLAARSPARVIAPGEATVDVINPGQSPDDQRAAMADGIIMRAFGRATDGKNGTPLVVDSARSREFANMSLLELGAEIVGIRSAHRMRPVALYEKLIERSMLGTTDYPLLLSAVANKFLLAQYQYQQPTYRSFSAKKTFNDFKTHNFLRIGDFPILEQLSETGEFRNGAVSENRETVTAITYGKIISMSRQMFINDDLSAFADLTGLAGRRIADFENSIAWGVVLSNSKGGPALSDTGNVWNSTAVSTAGGHANLAGTPADVTIASITAGRLAMRQQKSLDGVPLNVNPTIIVAGPAKQTPIEQLLSTSLLATQISNINPFNGGGITNLKPEIDAYITDNAWYLFADPAIAPAFVWGYVSGFEGPRFAIDQPFRYDGLSLKVAEDFGFGAIDWRPTYRNAGA